jgi:hypothetical protein
VSSPWVYPRQPSVDQEGSRLFCRFQASRLREAVRVSAELRTMAAGVVQVAPSPPRLPGRRDWIVTLTTPPMPLVPDVLKPWEGKMLAVEHRWPGCRFLGWRTWDSPAAPNGPTAWLKDDVAVAGQRSQRGLVLASLLRCPPVERRGIVHGRAVPR